MLDVSPEKLRAVIAAGETANVEFKLFFSSEAVRRYGLAFANSGGGIILFGIGPNGEIRGLSEEQVRSAQRRMRSASLRLPGVPIDCESTILDGKNIFVVSIGSAPAFFRNSGGAFATRRGRDFLVESFLNNSLLFLTLVRFSLFA